MSRALERWHFRFLLIGAFLVVAALPVLALSVVENALDLSDRDDTKS